MKEFIPLIIIFIVSFTAFAIFFIASLDKIFRTYMKFKDWKEDRRKKELNKDVD